MQSVQLHSDIVFYMVKHFVDVKSLLLCWLPSCKKLRQLILDPQFLINTRLQKLREDYPVIELYLKRTKTKSLIESQPFKFLLDCEDLGKNIIYDACAVLKRIFPAFVAGSLEATDHVLEIAETQKFSTIEEINNANKYGILLQPQWMQFFNICYSSNMSQKGLLFHYPAFQPLCWRYDLCEGLVQFAEWSDGEIDGSAYLFIICDIHSPWYGRVGYYIYQHDEDFHVLKRYWSFTEFLQLLIDNEGLAKRRIFRQFLRSTKVQIDEDHEGIIERPIGYFKPNRYQ